MPSPVAALPPPTTPISHGASEHEPIDPGTLEFRELWEDKERGLRFADLIDIINPLQHIPVVSTIYRAITGDQIGLGARLIGGALYGGGFGFAIATMQAAAAEANGQDVGASLLAFATGRSGSEPQNETVQTAAAAPEAAPDAALAAVPEAREAIAVAGSASPAPVPVSPASVLAADKAPSPLPAADRVAARDDAGDRRAFPAHPPHAVTPSQNERIMAAVEHARRAQAGMLLASLAAETPPAARARRPEPKDGDADTVERRAAPVTPPPAPPAVAPARTPARPTPPVHPNVLPAGASPEWIGAAMERALNKYEETLRLRGR